MYSVTPINKFETFLHLVGFTVHIYYDARPYERQKSNKELCWLANIAWYARIIVLVMEISRFMIETRHGLFPPSNKMGLQLGSCMWILTLKQLLDDYCIIYLTSLC